MIYTISNGELYHYGVKGMRWGVRRYQNKDGSLTAIGKKRQDRDMQKLESVVKKAGNAINKYNRFIESHTYTVSGSNSGNSIVIENPALRSKAIKLSKNVDKVIAKLEKRYDTVSAIPEKQARTGKMYVDVMIDDKKSRVFMD